MTKQEAIDELLTWDHLVMGSDTATPMCEAFGVPVPQEEYQPDARNDKGTKVIGIAAEDLAEHICKRLNIAYVPQMGRGSRLRMCCKALKESLT